MAKKNSNMHSEELNQGIPGKTGENEPVYNDIKSDPAYEELLLRYQKGEWDACMGIIQSLLIKYPEAANLHEMSSDINVKMMFQTIHTSETREKKREGVRNGLILLTLVGVTIFVVSYFIISSYQQKVNALQSEIVQINQDSVTLLVEQARSSLEARKPEIAMGILDKIEQMDPRNDAIAEIRQNAEGQLKIAVLYDQAMQSIEQGDFETALHVLQDVRSADPKFRDVNYQIDQAEIEIEIGKFLAAGAKAYNEKRWEDSIGSYEEVRRIRPNAISDQIINQMVFSYLRSIVETLSKKDQTIEELERSVGHYTKAISLIPQNSNFLSEREDLKKLSVDLLISKNYQIAKDILDEPNHSELNVSKAIKFLTTASNLNPAASVYKVETDKARKYLESLQNFNDEKWDLAITGFEELAKFDSTFPNKLASVRLYEAYVAKGDRYFRGGFYMDARIAFENAELLAWQVPENPMRLFTVQVRLGDTLGKLDNYKDAVSYYLYALNTIDAKGRLLSKSMLLDSIQKAEELNSTQKYYDAYLILLGSFKDMNELFEFETVDVKTGDNLVSLANEYHSTINEILANNKVSFPVITTTQQLIIPYIKIKE